jgi:RNA polymerase sigma factor for flagellar operon FliA
MLALFVSAQTYDASLGVPFASFASIRIRGAILDELRTMDWATRSVRQRAREVEAVQDQLTVQLDHPPRLDEIAGALKVTTGVLRTLQCDLTRANVQRLPDFSATGGEQAPPDGSAGPESLILVRERLGYLHDAIAELSVRLRFVINAYFFEQRPMSDIGAELGVSQPRVSQLCAEALSLLRDGINSQLDPSAVDSRGRSRRTAESQHAYFAAIADRGTLSTRLAMSTSRGDMLRRDCLDHSQIA